jgi:hypothetical protein
MMEALLHGGEFALEAPAELLRRIGGDAFERDALEGAKGAAVMPNGALQRRLVTGVGDGRQRKVVPGRGRRGMRHDEPHYA